MKQDWITVFPKISLKKMATNFLHSEGIGISLSTVISVNLQVTVNLNSDFSNSKMDTNNYLSNWDSLHARMTSHYKAWNNKK